MSEPDAVTSPTPGVPMDEILFAINLIVGEWGDGSWENSLPTMFAVWNANQTRARKIEDEGCL